MCCNTGAHFIPPSKCLSLVQMMNISAGIASYENEKSIIIIKANFQLNQCNFQSRENGPLSQGLSCKHSCYFQYPRTWNCLVPEEVQRRNLSCLFLLQEGKCCSWADKSQLFPKQSVKQCENIHQIMAQLLNGFERFGFIHFFSLLEGHPRVHLFW